MVILTGIHTRPDPSIEWYSRPESINLLEKQMLEDGRLLSKQSEDVDQFTRQNTHIFIDKSAYECWKNNTRLEIKQDRKIYNEEHGIISKNTVIEI